MLIEIFTAVIAFSMFIIAWSSRRYTDNNFLLILGIGYFFVGVSDLIHTLSYDGMPIFLNYSTDLPTQLWILARYFEALTFLGALLFLKKDYGGKPRIPTGKADLIFISYLAVFSLAMLAIFYWKIFPPTYIEGIGLTSFKKNSEYLISYIFLIFAFTISDNIDSSINHELIAYKHENFTDIAARANMTVEQLLALPVDEYINVTRRINYIPVFYNISGSAANNTLTTISLSYIETGEYSV